MVVFYTTRQVLHIQFSSLYGIALRLALRAVVLNLVTKEKYAVYQHFTDRM